MLITAAFYLSFPSCKLWGDLDSCQWPCTLCSPIRVSSERVYPTWKSCSPSGNLHNNRKPAPPCSLSLSQTVHMNIILLFTLLWLILIWNIHIIFEDVLYCKNMADGCRALRLCAKFRCNTSPVLSLCCNCTVAASLKQTHTHTPSTSKLPSAPLHTHSCLYGYLCENSH